MNPILISLYLIGIIIIEALVDGLDYRSRYKKLNGIWYHLFQQILILYVYAISKWIIIDLFTIDTLYIILAYAFYHYSIFDFLYRLISTNNLIGKGSFWDKVYNKFPILYSNNLRLLSLFVGIVVLILRFNN